MKLPSLALVMKVATLLGKPRILTAHPLPRGAHACKTWRMEQRPRPLAEMPPDALSAVRGVMTDIDDTLTRDGAIEPAALTALRSLAAAGVPVVAITGRPMGWSQPFADTWPVAAIVAENGAVALIRHAHGVQVEYAQDEPTRQANAARLSDVAARLLRDVPGAKLAQDSAGRVTDIAIDHSEFTDLPQAQIDQAVALMRSHGMNATVSSIHINGWFGEHTKFSAAAWMVQRLFGRELRPEIGQWIYVGDSTNDQLMFERFPLSVGVANLRRFAAALKVWPAYITQGERGAGFAELAAAVLAARGAGPLPA
jgi:HAD superfamily hydrolase (TIGR01484 family)